LTDLIKFDILKYNYSSLEEMKLVRKYDLVDCFKKIQGLMEAWPHMRKYYPKDERKFMEEVITNARKVQRVKKDNNNNKRKNKK